MNTPHEVRLSLYFAREVPLAVILRRGPRRLWRMILWDHERDEFQDGQWLEANLYPERCSLSADARHFLYFALDGHWHSTTRGSYTAISQPPYFTALALWPQGDTWNGGGRFLDARHVDIWANPGERDLIGRAKDLERVVPAKREGYNRAGYVYPDGREVTLSRTARSVLEDGHPYVPPGPVYSALAGCLYRDGVLVRDFSGMTFEPIRAPYDTRGQETGSAGWHPLDAEDQP